MVQAFRAELGITAFERKNVLAADFGSTYTKVAMFNASSEDVGVTLCAHDRERHPRRFGEWPGRLAECQRQGNWDPLRDAMDQFDIKLPCSSAKGGLKWSR